MSWVCVVPVKGSAGAKSRLGELPGPFPGRAELAEAFALDTVAALLAARMVERVLVVTGDAAAAAPLAALGAQIVPELPEATAAATPTAATPDAATPDAATPTAATPDAATPDAATPDAATPVAESPAKTTPAAEAPAAEIPAKTTPAAEAPAAESAAAESPVAETPNGMPAAPRDPLNAAIRTGIRLAHKLSPTSHVAVFTGDLPALTVADVESTLTAASGHDRAMVADEEGTGTTTLLARAGVTLVPRFGPGSRAAHEAAGHVPLDLPATSSIRRDVDTVDNLTEVLRRGVGPHTSALLARSQPLA